jgi:hypothetical protein
VDAGTTIVSVVAQTTDSNANVSVSGASGLVGGTNSVRATVTAENGTTATYSVTVIVDSLSSDTSLSLFRILNTNVADGDALEAPPGTTRVSVSAVASDTGATVVVSGNEALVAGPNTISVAVTAADGTLREVELRMLEEVREELAIDRLHAAAIEWGARVRHLRP